MFSALIKGEQETDKQTDRIQVGRDRKSLRSWDSRALSDDLRLNYMHSNFKCMHQGMSRTEIIVHIHYAGQIPGLFA